MTAMGYMIPQMRKQQKERKEREVKGFATSLGGI